MRKRMKFLCLIAALAVAAIGVAGCSSAPTPVNTGQSTDAPATAPAYTAPPSPGKTADVTALKIKDTKVGSGPEAKSGDLVTVDYTGWLTDGKQFDSSANSGQPFPFTIGNGEVIAGWDKGVAGMKVGGVRMLTIPPALGYGPTGQGPIPPNATLVFEVTLRKIN